MPFSLEKSPFPETWELGEGLKSLLSCFFLSNSYCHWREICWVWSDAKPQISDLNSRGDVNRNPERGRGTPLSRARSSRCPLGLAPVARGTRLLLGGAGQWRWDRGQTGVTLVMSPGLKTATASHWAPNGHLWLPQRALLLIPKGYIRVPWLARWN